MPEYVLKEVPIEIDFDHGQQEAIWALEKSLKECAARGLHILSVADGLYIQHNYSGTGKVYHLQDGEAYAGNIEEGDVLINYIEEQ